MVFQAVRAVLGDLLERVAKLLVAEGAPFGKQVTEIAKYLLDRLDVALVAVYQQLIAAGANAHIEERFKIFDVLVLNSKEGIEPLGWKF
jgi:hypothetical protein